MSKDFSIVFMGTPDFAVKSLDSLIKSNIKVKAVITAPDKPAGRGQQLSKSAVKIYAEQHNLPVLQPEKLKDETFIQELKNINADLFVIVAFRMLPEVVWSMPSKGSINLHASLLPKYRGAAPINWAVINGEKETGATTFFLQHEIDTGDIINSCKISIDENDTAGDVHDKLMNNGAELLVKTVNDIIQGNIKPIPQNNIPESELKHAPKIFKQDCEIDWNKSASGVHNLIRGLSPYPTAWCNIIDDKGNTSSLKIFKTTLIEETSDKNVGEILTDNKTYLNIVCGDNNIVSILELQLAGKKRLNVKEFLSGTKLNESWKFLSKQS